jgi:hypothetical protein
MRVLGCVYGIAHRELHTCAALSSQRSTYTLGEDASEEGTQQAFAESIAANRDIALVDLQGSPCVDVLSVSFWITVQSSPRTSKTNRAAASEACKGRN